ncbi:MAG: hypothetical protein AAF434_20650 [Pseudomonadota bacterium]
MLGNAARIETFDANEDVVADAARIVRACGADVGGVEYFIDTKSGQRWYYDYNPYSNFVADGEALLGFSPEQRYADFIESLIASS